MALVVIEDGVTGTESGYNQANAYSGGGSGEMGGYEDLPNPVPASDMVYDHVGRLILPSFEGMEGGLPDDIADGESHSNGFVVEIDEEWDLEEIHLVGLLIAPDGSIDNGGIASMDDAADNGYAGIANSALVSTSVKLYPNPTVGNTNIDLGTVQNEKVQVQVYDMNGKLITERNYGVLNGAYILPVESGRFEAGMYNVRIIKGSTSEVVKLVVE